MPPVEESEEVTPLFGPELTIVDVPRSSAWRSSSADPLTVLCIKACRRAGGAVQVE